MVILFRFQDDEIISLLKDELSPLGAPFLHELEGDRWGAETVKGRGKPDRPLVNPAARSFDAEAAQFLLIFLGRDGFDSHPLPGSEIHWKDFLAVGGIAARERGQGERQAGTAGKHRNSMLKRNGVPEAVP
ncbi:MAG: hypothetical protein IT166_09015 [Bryobacterales bacterium]|nr:hypothetical protein [Bryobacterales bacterium]